MNNRIRKKLARRYLDGGDVTRWARGTQSHMVSPDVEKTELIVPERLRRAIYSEAYRRGWDGCHWNNPLVISITDYRRGEA